jgi:hypothetical protein
MVKLKPCRNYMKKTVFLFVSNALGSFYIRMRGPFQTNSVLEKAWICYYNQHMIL